MRRTSADSDRRCVERNKGFVGEPLTSIGRGCWAELNGSSCTSEHPAHDLRRQDPRAITCATASRRAPDPPADHRRHGDITRTGSRRSASPPSPTTIGAAWCCAATGSISTGRRDASSHRTCARRSGCAFASSPTGPPSRPDRRAVWRSRRQPSQDYKCSLPRRAAMIPSSTIARSDLYYVHLD